MPHSRWLIKLLNEYLQRGKEEREGGRHGEREKETEEGREEGEGEKEKKGKVKKKK